MLKYQRLIAIIATTLCCAAPVGAADSKPLPPLADYNSVGFYNVSWSGIGVGGMALETREDAKSYHMEAAVKSNGLAWAFTKHSSVTSVDGIKRKGEYLPQKFETVFNLRDESRHIILTYDKNGKLVDEFNQPPENRKKRPEVPMDLKKDVVDALTPFFIQRHKVYEALRNGETRFTIRMFDGRHLTDLHYFVQGRKQASWNMQDVPVIHFVLTRTPVAGYKQSELDDYAAKKDPNVSLYLSDDGKLIPLKIEVDSSAGTFYANYQQNCDSMEVCKALLK